MYHMFDYLTSQLSSEKVDKTSIVQTTGDSTTVIMSQKAVSDALEKQGQQTLKYAESIDWLKANGDQSKMYFLPDGMIYAYMPTEVESKPSYTNILPLAVNADGTPYVGNNGEKGYKTDYRLNSSKAEVAATGMCCTGFMPITNSSTGTLRLKNITPTGAQGGYLYAFGEDRSSGKGTSSSVVSVLNNSYDATTGVYTLLVGSDVNDGAGTLGGFGLLGSAKYLRLSIGNINENTIITWNEEITEDGSTSTSYDWTSTGLAFVSADFVADMKAQGMQQSPEYAEGDTIEEQLVWLAENGDQSKLYLLADGFLYQWKLTQKEVESGSSYTNILPTATDTDRTTIYNGKGYSDGGKRLSSSGSEGVTGVTNNAITGFINNVSVGDVIRIKNFWSPNGVTNYLISYNSSNAKVNYQTWGATSTEENWLASPVSWTTVADGVVTVVLTEALFGTGFDAIRFSGVITADTIVTINEEIKEGGGTTIVTEEAWVSTGHAFVPADYEDRIVAVEEQSFSNTKRIIALEKSVENGSTGNATENGGTEDVTEAEALTRIKEWDKPIYERLTPFLLETDLNIDTTYPKTYTDSQDSDGAYRRQNVQAVYNEYNALCTAHPDFVRDITDVEHGLDGATETTFGGLCSDGIQYVRVYEFCEREGRHSNTTNTDYWSETKPTFIIVSGIHWEYNGVYSMLNALKLITENPDLRDMRRNCRFIVIPMSNPYCFTTYGNSGGGHYNANGVEIHNNFKVDFNNAIDATHGTAPLSEVETRYIDNAMRKYADTGVCLLTCHSNATKGSNFIWGSVATKFMCNVSMRLVDLMSYAWDSKYENYRTAIDTQKVGNSNPQEDGDYRCGFASLSTSTGTETKQALWYGMQGINVEVYEKFYLFDPDGSDMALAVSRGAEVYANLLRLLAVTYDHNDRDKYAPSPAYKSE